jgi:hypothetical protein
MDVVVTRLGESPELFRGAAPQNANWIAFRLTGSKSNRSAIGAKLELQQANGAIQVNRVSAATGYASSSQLPVHFGLGDAKRVERIVVRWPSGVEQSIEAPEVNRLHSIKEP